MSLGHRLQGPALKAKARAAETLLRDRHSASRVEPVPIVLLGMKVGLRNRMLRKMRAQQS